MSYKSLGGERGHSDQTGKWSRLGHVKPSPDDHRVFLPAFVVAPYSQGVYLPGWSLLQSICTRTVVMPFLSFPWPVDCTSTLLPFEMAT